MTLPFLAPTLSIWIFVFRIIIAISAVMLTNSPLIVDYISHKSRGRMGISVYFGQRIGEIFVFLGLLTLIR